MVQTKEERADRAVVDLKKIIVQLIDWNEIMEKENWFEAKLWADTAIMAIQNTVRGIEKEFNGGWI